MKSQKLKEIFRKRRVKVGSVMLAAVIAVGGGMSCYESQNQVPELVTFVDMEGSIELAEEEVPLAAPTVTTSTKTKTKKKKIKMKKASTKTYSRAGKTKTKKTKKTAKTKKNITTTETVVTTSVVDQYTKGSKIDLRLTTEKTVVTKTVTTLGAEKNTLPEAKAMVDIPAKASEKTGKTTTVETPTAKTVTSGTVAVTDAAPKADKRVISAFGKLGFKIVVNPNVSYSGVCDARTRTITLKRLDDTVYHELGHFVAFVAGNVDTASSFKNIYNREKSKYTAYNKAYVLSNSSEYFAESFRNYVLNPTELKASRPETYQAIEQALAKMTDAQATRILNAYGAFWK